MAVVLGDAVALSLGTIITLTLLGYLPSEGLGRMFLVVGIAVITGLWAMRSQGLWILRTCAIRVIEIARLGRACGLLGIILVTADRVASLSLDIVEAGAAVAACWLLLVVWRSAVRLRLRAQRRQGKRLRRVVVIGTDERARDLIDALVHDPDGSTVVVGVIGPEPAEPIPAHDAGTAPWLGEISAAPAMLDAFDPDLVVISGHLHGAQTDGLVDQQQAAGRAVMIDPDLGTFHLRRLEVVPVAYEPLLHVESVHLSRPSLALKWAFDTVVTMAFIVVLSPVLGAIALAVKLDDRGPVFFRQTHVGRNGRLFSVYKFRTMHVDAEKQLVALREQNQRNGPLFKLDHDPRVTKIGQFLRDSSLDELPQLFNVALGHMSLVGPLSGAAARGRGVLR